LIGSSGKGLNLGCPTPADLARVHFVPRRLAYIRISGRHENQISSEWELMAAKVGSVFRWRRDALGIAAGTAGVCYCQLDDALAGVLFETGAPAALSDVELLRYAQYLGASTELSTYRFEGLIQLLDDFAAGHFERAMRGELTEHGRASAACG
jgi:hypothetical protein